MLKKIMNQYNNQGLSGAEVLQELINMRHEMKAINVEAETLGLTTEELAFYDDLTNFETDGTE